VDTSPYANLPHRSRGRLRALAWKDGTDDTLAFTYVANDREVFITDTGKTDVAHNGNPTMRNSYGRYFVMSQNTDSFRLFRLDKVSGVYDLVEKTFTLNRVRAPQIGSEFYIWWPGPNLLLSRSYNQRSFEIYSFHKDTYSAIDTPASFSEDQLIDGPYIPEFNILGDIMFDPVYRSSKMYVPIKETTYGGTTTYKVRIYSATTMIWGITQTDVKTVSSQITSIASYADAVIATHTTKLFFNVDENTDTTPTYTGGAPTCTLEWKFIQARPNPDNTNQNPPVYAFCIENIIYPTSYDASTKVLTIDTTNLITLPDDKQESRHQTGRYNLKYPYDISGDYLINFAIHKCSAYILYKWEEWKDMSVSVYNLATKTTKCIDVTNAEASFE